MTCQSSKWRMCGHRYRRSRWSTSCHGIRFCHGTFQIFGSSSIDVLSLGDLWLLALVIVVNLHLAMDVVRWYSITHAVIWESIPATVINFCRCPRFVIVASWLLGDISRGWHGAVLAMSVSSCRSSITSLFCRKTPLPILQFM